MMICYATYMLIWTVENQVVRGDFLFRMFSLGIVRIDYR
jgi:hypothetical protein